MRDSKDFIILVVSLLQTEPEKYVSLMKYVTS